MDQTRNEIRQHYAKVAETEGAVGCAPGCCTTGAGASAQIGYSPEEMAAVPEGANLGLGCGNPQAIAALKEGEVVVDLGSGAGFDCFLAARRVGTAGRVIGVDMTIEMINKARGNAERVEAKNVEFRLGEIERLPLADGTADVIISNCVVNLSTDKPSVFAEAFRVLKPGGRVAISDVVAMKAIPQELTESLLAVAGCVGGAAQLTDVERMLTEVGFEDVRVTPRPESREVIAGWLPGTSAEDYVTSATIEATKPGGDCCEPTCCA
ncbi:MAG: arsenite methyltransferase [Deltaproteobacteria bacterium]